MDANTLVIVSTAVGAAIGAVVGLLVGRAIRQGMGLMIAIAVIAALAGGGLGWFIANHDLVPRQQFDAARQAAEDLPEVKVLKAHYPADYAKLQNELERIKGERGGAVAVSQTVRAATNAAMLREAPKASDANLLLLMKLKRDKAEALAAKSPAYCYDFTRNARLTFDPDTVVDAALVQRERDTAAAILTQTATAPVVDAEGTVANPDELPELVKQYYQVELRDEVAAKARSGFPEADQKIIRQLTGRRMSLDDPARQMLICRYNIALIDETLKLSPEKAAMVYRMNLGRGL